MNCFTSLFLFLVPYQSAIRKMPRGRNQNKANSDSAARTSTQQAPEAQAAAPSTAPSAQAWNSVRDTSSGKSAAEEFRLANNIDRLALEYSKIRDETDEVEKQMAALQSRLDLLREQAKVKEDAMEDAFDALQAFRKKTEEEEEKQKREATERAAALSPEEQHRRRTLTRPICRYFGNIRGCREGFSCRFAHELRQPAGRARQAGDNDNECCVCYENPSTKSEGKFALLSDCDHVFCMECIKAWKKEKPQCPMCRAHISLFIASERCLKGEERLIAMEQEKERRGKLPCRTWTERGSCPFKKNCWFMHPDPVTGEDQRPNQETPRRRRRWFDAEDLMMWDEGEEPEDYWDYHVFLTGDDDDDIDSDEIDFWNRSHDFDPNEYGWEEEWY